VGYAFEDEEETDGVCCIAAAAFGLDGRVVGAVGTTALSSQIKAASVESVARRVQAAADEISSAYANSVPSTAVPESSRA
jgi:IclR family transcriptional regulator, acetate operon repressor